MASKLKLSKLAGLVAAAVTILVAPGAAQADALAQSILDITDFKIAFNPAQITLTSSPSVATQSSATFNNVAGASSISGLSTITRVGPDAALYTHPILAPSATQATTAYPTAALPGNFAGGFAAQSGDATTAAGAAAVTDATVSIVPMGAPLNGSQGSNTVGQEFTVTVAKPGFAAIGLSFDADSFLRAYLSSGPSYDFLSGSANASSTWRIEVFRVVSSTLQPIVASWSPGGTALNPNGWGCNAVYVIGCVELSPFQLNRNIVAFGDGDDLEESNSGSFTGGLSLLGGETYRFSLNHTSIANADILLRENRIPEPGTLALSGLALLAIGAISRRRKTA